MISLGKILAYVSHVVPETAANLKLDFKFEKLHVKLQGFYLYNVATLENNKTQNVLLEHLKKVQILCHVIPDLFSFTFSCQPIIWWELCFSPDHESPLTHTLVSDCHHNPQGP